MISQACSPCAKKPSFSSKTSTVPSEVFITPQLYFSLIQLSLSVISIHILLLQNCHAFKNLVGVSPSDIADFQWRGINKRNSGAGSLAKGFKKDCHSYDSILQKLDKAVYAFAYMHVNFVLEVYK
jgi:hypothetical protein